MKRARWLMPVLGAALALWAAVPATAASPGPDLKPAAKTISFSSATYTVGEATANATITLTRSTAKGTATVQFATVSGGTATAGSDYTSTSRTVSFRSGATSASVSVPIINDTTWEPTETVNLQISNPGGSFALGAQTTAVLSIIDNDALPAPTNLAAEVQSTVNVHLTWDAVTGATGYTVFRSTTSGSGYSSIGTPTTTSYDDLGLSTGTYFYVLQATNASGPSANSNEVTVEILAQPPAPANLAAEVQNLSDVHLTWDAADRADGGYSVFRSTTSGSGFSQLGIVFTTSYDDTGLADGVYYYMVEAMNSFGFSPPSNEVRVGIRSSNTALASNGDFETGDFTGWTIGAIGSAAEPTIESDTVAQGVYGALLGNPSGTEPYGNSWMYQTVTLPVGGHNYLTFAEFPLSQDTVTYDQQQVLIQDADGNPLATVINEARNDNAWLQRSVDLSPFEGQTVRVVFQVHQDGAGDPTSMRIDDVRIDNLVLAPAAPVASASAAGVAIDVSWGAVPFASYYQVHRAETSGGYYSLVATTNDTHFVDTAVSEGTPYFYLVEAINPIGASQVSNEVSATTAILTKVFSDNLEGDTSGWTTTGLWHLADSSTCPGTVTSGALGYSSPTHAFYYGQDSSCNYDTGSANTGDLTTTVAVTAGHPAYISAQYFYDGEASFSSSSDAFDIAHLDVSLDGGTTFQTVWAMSNGKTVDTWTELSSGMVMPTGSSIVLRFHFDTVDGQFNAYLGWLIDDITVKQ